MMEHGGDHAADDAARRRRRKKRAMRRKKGAAVAPAVDSPSGRSDRTAGESAAAAQAAGAAGTGPRIDGERSAESASPLGALAARAPTISAIVPNYNHMWFIAERLRSIVKQKLPVSEIIILDDASTDASRDIIERLIATIRIPVKVVCNERNSGSVFAQWAKGIGLAKGDLIWICESDDSCRADFLSRLVPYFEDPSVMLAFGKVVSIDELGRESDVLDAYREGAAQGYWEVPRVEAAFRWFQGPFGVRNVIPNVGGCIFRRQELTPEVLEAFLSYRISGDWYLYSRLARGGKIAYDPGGRCLLPAPWQERVVSRVQVAGILRPASHAGQGSPPSLRRARGDAAEEV
jgi:hypothetical protein